jgi:hypothetical protein
MIPTQQTTIVADGAKLFTDLFKVATNTNAILAAVLAETQAFENALFVSIPGRTLAGALAGGYSDVLDKIGSIVGEARQGRTDANYAVAIQIRITVNDSQGKAEDLLKIGSLAFNTGFDYEDSITPAVWIFTALDLPGFPQVSRYLGQAKAAGTRGVVIHSEPVSGPHFTFGSTYGGPAGLGSGSTYVPSFVSTDVDATGI